MRILTHSKAILAVTSLRHKLRMLVLMLCIGTSSGLYSQCMIECPLAATNLACDADFSDLFVLLGGTTTDCGVVVVTDDFTHPGACGDDVVVTYTITSDGMPVTDPICATTITVDPAIAPTVTPPVIPPGPLTCDEAAAFVFTDMATYTNSLAVPCEIMGTIDPVVTPAFTACDGGTITITFDGVDACGNVLSDGPYVIAVDPAPAVVITPAVVPPGPLTCDEAVAFTFTDPATYTNAAAEATCLDMGEIPPVVVADFDACAGGTITITFDGVDACGNALSDGPYVIAVDPAPAPVVSMPVITAGPMTCDAAEAFTFTSLASYTNMGMGACLIEGTIPPVVTKTFDACAGGMIEITYNGVDGCGNPVAPVAQPAPIVVLPAPAPMVTPPAIPSGPLTCDEAAAFAFTAEATYTNLGAGGPACEVPASNCCLIEGTIPPVLTPDFTACDGGTITIEFEDVDACGNPVVTGPFVISVMPTEAPVLDEAPPAEIYACDAIPAPSLLDYTNSAVDAGCLIEGMVLSVQTAHPGACGGEITETWTLAPDPGNCLLAPLEVDRIITVLPASPPAFEPPPAALVLECGDPLPPIADLAYTNGGTGDCLIMGTAPGVPMTADGCVPGMVGVTTITWTVPAVDDCTGIGIIATQTITFVDTTDPVFDPCPADIIMAAPAADCEVVVVFPDPTVMDCDPATVVSQTGGPASGSVFPVGATTITYTAVDCSGNEAVCSFDIIVEDVGVPTITCPAPVVIATDAGVCTWASDMSIMYASASDNCPDFVVTHEITGATVVPALTPGTAVGTVFGKGVSTVIYSAADADGMPIGTCMFDVTVEDMEPPLCPTNNLTVALDPVTNMASITVDDIDAGWTDNCEIVSSSIDIDMFTCADLFSKVGNILVTATIEDCSGNTFDCFAQVHVDDNVDPECIPMDAVVNLDADGMVSITSADVDGGSVDNCTPVVVTATPDEFTCDNIGENVVTLWVTDCDDNTSFCDAIVTVVDVTAPICMVQDITVELDVNGMASITADQLDNGSTDECCLDFVSASPLAFNCASVGVQPVTFTATDCSGNESIPCLALVTVEDNILPECTGIDQTVYLDPTGTAILSGPDVAQGTDNCSVGSIIADPLIFSCADAESVVTTSITVTDIFGNENTCTANITVLDFVAPTCLTMDITVPLDADGLAEIAVADIDAGSFDNCMPIVVAAAPLSFTCDNVGANVVTMTVTDPSGNISVCSATVTIADDEGPTCTPMDIDLYLDADGMASITVADVAVVEDNCCLGPVALDIMDFSCVDTAAPVVVEITAEDCSMNMLAAPCMANVTVADTLAPVCTAGSETVDLAMEECEAAVAFILPLPVDNCDPAPIVTAIPGEPVSGDVFPSGTTPVMYLVEDAEENVDTCVFNVIVNEFPLSGISCQNINLSLDETCTGSITPLMVLTGNNFPCLENCEITITDAWGNPVDNDFGPENVGETYQYMICCNGLCCWGDIQIDYKLPPTIMCPYDLTVACNGLDLVDESLVVTDFCADGELVLLGETIDNLHCDDDYLSVVTRTYVAIDEFGNESNSCTFDIYLERVNLDYVECPDSRTKQDNTALSCGENYPVDENGHPSPYDPVTGEGTGVPVYVVPAEIAFEDTGAMIGNLTSSAIKLCDLNGDGIDDLFSVNYTSPNKVYFGDGMGNFTDSGQNLGLGDTRDVALADFDGDGDKDAFFSELGQEDMVWLNDGMGVFMDSGQALGLPGASSSNVEACDIDGDGDIDAIVTSFAAGTTIYFNDGTGDFSMNTVISMMSSNSSLLFDVDGDGDKDAIITVGGTHLEVWFNDGSGGFTNSSQMLGSGNFVRFEFCDLDADGDNDLFAHEGFGAGAQVFLNDGLGVFSDTGQNLGTSLGADVVLFDIDCDGDKDAFLSNFGPNEVFLNDGNGVFTNTGLAIGSTNDFESEITDIDGDGDLDIITANFSGPNMIWTNNTVCERRLELFPEVSNELCNVAVSYTDIEIPGINCVTKIMRSWTVNEWWCSSELNTGCFQIIEIADTLGPVFDCPAHFSMTTTEDCEGLVYFPAVDAVDDCSPIGQYLIDWPTGSLNTNGGHGTMPIGVHTVTYTVFDECYNESSCTTEVTVADSTEPIALCEQNTVVSIGTTPYAVVYATTFDDGSFDDCYIDSIGVRRMTTPCPDYYQDTIYYKEKVHFCCADVGDPDIMVQLRVWDKSGNFNDCMVNVEVQDKVPPTMTCIDDVTIQCDDPVDLDNLGFSFGYPTIVDNCADPSDLIEEVDDQRNQCGTGFIVRKMILEDDNSVTIQECIQTITVVSDNPFVYGDIFWPRDTSFTNLCSIEDLDPEDLPEFYNKPRFLEEECQLVGYNYEDQVFEFVEGEDACVKIIRTWRVIDWCQPVIDGEYVTWSEQQVIKLDNTIDPVIDAGCDGQVIETADIDCEDALVTLMPTATDDCTPSDLLVWKYEIDLFSDGSIQHYGDTNDATLEYPIGLHTIYWTVEDQCGNFDTCENTFEIVSTKAPTPVCIHGLSVDLVPMDLLPPFGEPDNEMVTLWASDFDAHSFHPCGYDIALSFSSDVNDTNKTFDCNSCGLQDVELWVTTLDSNGDPVVLPDGSLLQAFCITFVDVQDNNEFDFCPDCRIGIQGRIATKEGMEVPNVEVDLSGAATMEMTNENGIYEFGNMDTGGAYEVVPFYDQDPLNGVSTLDIVKIQRHVLGIANLESPYDLIAADANNDESITAQDLLEIRRLILDITDSFTNNTSWRFVNKEQTFINPANPWSTGIEESYGIGSLDGNMIIDFVGIKTADVNGSATMLVGTETDNRNASTKTLDYIIEGNMVHFYSKENHDLRGFQIALDIQGMNVVNITSELVGFDDTAFYQAGNDVRISYAAGAGIALNSSDILFSMELESNIPVVSLGESLDAEIYVNNGLDIHTLDLERKSVEGEVFVTNYPNPWLKETIIEFESNTTGAARILFYDAKGAKEKVLEINTVIGLNQISIPRSYFSVAGVKTYQLIIDNEAHFGKMLLLE